MHFAKPGRKVDVFEKNNFFSGHCSLIHHEGYCFDQGSSLLLLPSLLYQTFADLGSSLIDAGVELIKCEPTYRVYFHDDESIVLSTDLSVVKGETERIEGENGLERYMTWLLEAHQHYELSVEHVPKKNFCSFFSLFRPSFLAYMVTLYLFVSIWSRTSEHFMTERLHPAFALRASTRIPRFLRALTPHQVHLLQNGTLVEAGVIVYNADLVSAFKNLLPRGPAVGHLYRKPGNCSSISFYWFMNYGIPKFSAHKSEPPAEPSFYANAPSRTDPRAAPEGKDSVVVLVPTDRMAVVVHTVRKKVPQATHNMLDLGNDVLESKIVHELVNMPETWCEKFDLDKGTILGLSHSFLCISVLSFRPSTKHAQINSCCFVRASAHPCTGYASVSCPLLSELTPAAIGFQSA
ncbi:hypothetical protein K488DRAFT_80315 [Vararia minispora EC-137]|uniref:Uncharacterized protein n=1 Tax=Vararia minispora EC-137 TaxID=1314806 RepID=A0ACB8QBN9_9AGAM|nr:hypothetical protein K488DRAFT_80315 [Vararia minispora EC-137]